MSPKPGASAINNFHGSRNQRHLPKLSHEPIDTLSSFLRMTSQAADSHRTNLKYLACKAQSLCLDAKLQTQKINRRGGRGFGRIQQAKPTVCLGFEF